MMKARLNSAVAYAGLAGGLLAAATVPTSAWAQEASASATPPQTAAPADPAPDAHDIVVTAQRRSEKLKDVPLSVTVYNAKELAATGVQGVTALASAVPGLQIQATGGHFQPNIRGIGTVQSSAGSESNIALYVDGIYMPNQALNVFDLEDLESVQVLKGPQGSLYGRNATGGAILVTTRRPSRDFELKLTGSYGSFNEVRLSGYLTAPLSDTLSASISALYSHDDGYGRDVIRKVPLQYYKEFHVRGKILYQPTAATSILVSGDYGRVDDDETLALKVWNGNTNFPALNPVIPAGPHDYALSFTPYADRRGWGGSVDISHDFGGVTLRSLSGLRQLNYHNETDNDRISEIDTRFEVLMDQRTYSEELTLSSDNSGPFRWLVGAYYINDRTSSPTYSKPTGTNRVLVTDSVIDARALSGYFEGTYDITPKFSVLIGGRYSTENRSIDQTRPTGTVLSGRLDDVASQFTPKASLIYKVSDTTNVYFTYNKGFKSGAYVATSFLVPATRPETVDGYEAGLKYASGGASFNTSAYYYKYKDIQYNSRLPSGLSFLLNAAAAEIYGLDAELTVPLSREFELRASGAYTHAAYTSFINPPVLSPALPNGTGGNVAVTGVDVTGNQMIRTPKFTANIAGTYTHDFGPGKLGINGSFYYNDGFPWLPEGRLYQKSYVLVNGEISWTSSHGYRFAVWGKNLTNSVYAISTSITANDAIAYQRPRSWGVSAAMTFR